MLRCRPSFAVLLAAALGAGLPACLLDASAFDGAPEPTGGAGGGTTTGMGASTSHTTGTAGVAGGTGAGASGGAGGAPGGSGGAGGTGGTPLVEGDLCPGKPVPVAVYTEVLVDADTTLAHDDYGSKACGGGDAPEIVYAVTPLSDGILTATLEPSPAFAGFIHLRTTCGDFMSEVAGCGATMKLPVTKDAPVFVFVDGHANDPDGAPAGTYKLRLSLNGCGNGTLEPDNEECDDANLVENDTCTAGCKVRCTGEGSIATNSDTYVHPVTHHCYLQSYDPNSKWADAANDCVAWGGTLAALTTTQEISDLAGLLNNTGEDVWIGGDDTAADGTFVWLTGEPWTYTNGNAPWESHAIGANEPNGGNGENCVEIYKSGRLNDDSCNNQENWMCERPPAGQASAQ